MDLMKGEEVGAGIFCRGQHEEGLTMPNTSKGFTSQRRPAWTMPDPRGPDTSPITSAIQGRKAREYPKLNEEKKKQNTKTDVMKLTKNLH